MEAKALHDLTAGYALNALGPSEEEAYEEHLARCPRCREELASFAEVAGTLAYGVETPPPAPGLRDRILEQARSERPNVLSLRPRFVTVTRAVAAVAACAAVGFGVWAITLSRQLDRERSAERRIEAVLGSSSARPIALSGGRGTLFVAPSGRAVLAVSKLERAPRGRTYEAWVIRRGTPERAGLFEGGGSLALVPLDRTVPNGARVAVTLERAGGVDAPQGQPLFSASA
jgi:anti-sigma factor RsiW